MAQGFLAGLLAADGSIGTTRYNARFHTADKAFQEEIGLLCTKTGLSYNLYSTKTGQFVIHEVVLRDHRSVEALESFGFIKLRHKEKIEEHKNMEHMSNRYNEWPVNSTGILDLARKVRKTRKPRLTQRSMISKANLIQKILQIKSSSEKLNRQEHLLLDSLETLAKSPLVFRKIERIELLDHQPDYVYCFQLNSPTPWFLIQGSIITHNCFGYLGFKNARWGSIEAHQGVTAFGRRYLLDARKICEKAGFEVIAGITDSLFIRAKDEFLDEIDSREALEQLVDKISKDTGIPMDIEGKFQWLVFSAVKEYEDVAALNRYYGMFIDGKYKLRGIKHRQRRAFKLEKDLTEDILEVMAQATCVDDFLEVMPLTYKVLQHHIQRLRKRTVPPSDLVTKLKSGRGSGNYKATSTLQAIATKRYAELGDPVHPGESFFFIVVDDSKKKSIDRVQIGEEITDKTEYDTEYYIEQLNRDYLEMTIEIQRQLFGKVKFDKEGIKMNMDEFWTKIPELFSDKSASSKLHPEVVNQLRASLEEDEGTISAKPRHSILEDQQDHLDDFF